MSHFYCSCVGHEEVTRLLIENDANINAKAHGGRKALKSMARQILKFQILFVFKVLTRNFRV